MTVLQPDFLLHIVPAVPPAANGLGDYCYKLWENWPEPKPNWHCLAPTITTGSQDMWREATLSTFQLSRDGMLNALEQARIKSVVLHYVGHGYDPKGCPVWMPQALRQWKHQGRDRTITVMFHECYFSRGKPWQTSFWLSHTSKTIMIELVNIADHWVTSSGPARDKLISEGGAQPSKGTLIPVGSSIFTDSTIVHSKPWPLTKKKKLRLVVFGLPSTRIDVLKMYTKFLIRMLEVNLVESITLVGKSNEYPERERRLIEAIGHAYLWRNSNDLSHGGISKILADQDLGLVSTHPYLLTKSTVYAAFCTHGVIPVAKETSVPHKGGVPFLALSDKDVDKFIERIRNANEIDEIKAQIKETTENYLSWKTIGRKWAEIVGMKNGL